MAVTATETLWQEKVVTRLESPENFIQIYILSLIIHLKSLLYDHFTSVNDTTRLIHFVMKHRDRGATGLSTTCR